MDCEPLYLTSLLQKKLRIGVAEQNLLAALGHAAAYYEKHSTPPVETDHSLEEAEKIVKQVYSVVPVYDKIVLALHSGGLLNLPKACRISLGIFVEPMLAKPATRVSEIMEKFQDMEFTCEYKYDGERAQIHYAEDGNVEIYSRKGQKTTNKFPDVAAAVTRLKKPFVTSFVLDCELVAYDLEKQKILTRQYLYKSFQEEPGFLQFATAVTSTDIEEIQNFFYDAVNSSCEGLVIKTLNKNATYEPSKRSQTWVKLKKDYMAGIDDSLDLVPIAAFNGKGKLAAFGASTNPRSEVIPRPKVMLQVFQHYQPRCIV